MTGKLPKPLVLELVPFILRFNGALTEAPLDKNTLEFTCAPALVEPKLDKLWLDKLARDFL